MTLLELESPRQDELRLLEEGELAEHAALMENGRRWPGHKLTYAADYVSSLAVVARLRARGHAVGTWRQCYERRYLLSGYIRRSL